MQSEGLPPEFSHYIPDILEPHVMMVARAALSLPFAAILGAVLAFRPRARGTPPRSAAVIQTQIVLSVIGGVVMVIVGSSVARAFGIVGVASLIRYRSKIDDPKDASVMLGCLTVGLASGVELYGLAAFSTLFLLGVLWVVESLEPERLKTFDLEGHLLRIPPRFVAISSSFCAGAASSTSCARPVRRSLSTKPISR
jgi:hypothetical protein